jgi:hypothetical protein
VFQQGGQAACKKGLADAGVSPANENAATHWNPKSKIEDRGLKIDYDPLSSILHPRRKGLGRSTLRHGAD